MTTLSPNRPAVFTPGQRLLASLRAGADERPHPAMLALARQPRTAAREQRRLAEFLRIARGRSA